MGKEYLGSVLWFRKPSEMEENLNLTKGAVREEAGRVGILFIGITWLFS
jgi:hypothetical protein